MSSMETFFDVMERTEVYEGVAYSRDIGICHGSGDRP